MAELTNVPAIRRAMHLAYADLTPKELEDGLWPVVKFLLEGWDADRGAVSQVAIERERAWNEVDRYRRQIALAREANALLVEELAVARGRAKHPAPGCELGACDSYLAPPDPEAGIRHVTECGHGRVFLWEDGCWVPMPVRGEPGWKPARDATGPERRHLRVIGVDQPLCGTVARQDGAGAGTWSSLLAWPTCAKCRALAERAGPHPKQADGAPRVRAAMGEGG